MSTKVSKVVRELGRADDSGLSFPESDFLYQTRIAYEAAKAQARQQDGLTTGPATIKIIVEQEFIQ